MTTKEDHWLGAEQAVLGCILFDIKAMTVAKPLVSLDFQDPLHQRLYEAMEEQARKVQWVDPITLADQFKHDAAFQKVGGLYYLADLVDRSPPVSNVAKYAFLVREHSGRHYRRPLADAQEPHRWLVDPEWWESVLAAGACWRASTHEPWKPEWVQMAEDYHKDADSRLANDIKGWGDE